mgnify:CR=1 FL=1
MKSQKTASELVRSERDDGPLLDVDGAADLLGTSVRHIRRLRAASRIPFVKIGAKLRFRRSELDAYIEANSHPAVDDRDWGTER